MYISSMYMFILSFYFLFTWIRISSSRPYVYERTARLTSRGRPAVPPSQVSVMMSEPCLPRFRRCADGQTPFVLLSLEGGDIKRDDKDVLPRQKCLDALAALRHAKWFQVHSPIINVCALHAVTIASLCLACDTFRVRFESNPSLLLYTTRGSAHVFFFQSHVCFIFHLKQYFKL